MNIDVVITIWCESIQRGCTFSARVVDGAHARFYSGQGATAFEAVAWALHDYVSRAVLGQPHTMARTFDARPGDGLVARSIARPRTITPAPPIASAEPAAAQDQGAESGCFERVIPTSPAPRLFSLESPVATPTPTTARRRAARGARR